MVDVNGDESLVVKLDGLGRVRWSRGHREAMLDEFERSGVSAAVFAERVGVKYTTFAGWALKRRRSRGDWSVAAKGNSQQRQPSQSKPSQNQPKLAEPKPSESLQVKPSADQSQQDHSLQGKSSQDLSQQGCTSRSKSLQNESGKSERQQKRRRRVERQHGKLPSGKPPPEKPLGAAMQGGGSFTLLEAVVEPSACAPAEASPLRVTTARGLTLHIGSERDAVLAVKLLRGLEAEQAC